VDHRVDAIIPVRETDVGDLVGKAIDELHDVRGLGARRVDVGQNAEVLVAKAIGSSAATTPEGAVGGLEVDLDVVDLVRRRKIADGGPAGRVEPLELLNDTGVFDVGEALTRQEASGLRQLAVADEHDRTVERLGVIKGLAPGWRLQSFLAVASPRLQETPIVLLRPQAEAPEVDAARLTTAARQREAFS
jgi:hypothetical protein